MLIYMYTYANRGAITHAEVVVGRRALKCQLISAHSRQTQADGARRTASMTINCDGMGGQLAGSAGCSGSQGRRVRGARGAPSGGAGATPGVTTRRQGWVGAWAWAGLGQARSNGASESGGGAERTGPPRRNAPRGKRECSTWHRGGNMSRWCARESYLGCISAVSSRWFARAG